MLGKIIHGDTIRQHLRNCHGATLYQISTYNPNLYDYIDNAIGESNNKLISIIYSIHDKIESINIIEVI